MLRLPRERPQSCRLPQRGDEWADDEAVTSLSQGTRARHCRRGRQTLSGHRRNRRSVRARIISRTLKSPKLQHRSRLRHRVPPPRQNGLPIAPKKPDVAAKRENALQKISHLDVKGRIQLALKGNKEERSLLIRDGTKVVALAVLEAPKLSDGEVEKFASQKNVLEAVLRQIPLKRRFMKNYKVVRNLVANPRTPLDLGLGLMKNLLIQDLKNISGNKEVSETIRKLALKMYKQKEEQANKK